MSVINAHRARKIYAECLAIDPVLIDEDPEAQGDNKLAAVGAGVDGEQTASAAAETPAPTRTSPGSFEAEPPSKTRTGVHHLRGFTPVRAQYAFPAQMHALYDFFVSNGYEGTMQDWVIEMVLKCCGEHYRLRFGVYIERPAVVENGARRG